MPTVESSWDFKCPPVGHAKKRGNRVSPLTTKTPVHVFLRNPHTIHSCIHPLHFFLFTFFFLGLEAMAQTEYTPAEKTWPSLKVHGYAQIWGRYAELNPGTLVGDNPVDQVWDISVRRYRLGIRGNLTEHLDYFLVIGNNNFNIRESSLEITLLDLFFNYHFADWGTLTAGKTVLTGLSRYAGPSASNAFGLDVNFASNPYLNNHDQRFRKFAVGVHGLLGSFMYKFVVAKPNFRDVIPELTPQAILFNDPLNVYTSGYGVWQLLESEPSNAFARGTYYGRKHLLNIGAGYSTESRASASIGPADGVEVHSGFSYAIDVFYESKLRNRQSLTLYGAYFNHDIGPNYLRFLGINSIATGSNEDVSLNGPGTASAASGSGSIFVAQAGYYWELAETIDGNRGIQPFVQYQYSDLDGLNEPAHFLELGVHYLMRENYSRLTLGYQNWSVFSPDSRMSGERKGLLVLMYQMKF